VLKAPFPWFGGKSRAASLIWPRFGDVANYVEPFFGSGAVLLARPTAPRIETVNDLDCFLANFWRSIAADPEQTAHFADWPVNEADQHARHRWLVNRVEFRERMRTDPEHYDPKIAGWWVWGLCAWIGSGWCAADPGGEVSDRLPAIGGMNTPDGAKAPKGTRSGGRAVHSSAMRGGTEGPALDGQRGDGGSPNIQLPHLGHAGRGVHRKIPHLGDAGRGSRDGDPSLAPSGSGILATFEALRDRMRHTRVACGDFERVLSDSVTWRHGTTAILLDAPYADGEEVYSAGEDPRGVFARTAKWAAEHGADKRLRICLCGYAGTWAPPEGWEEVPWKAHGGYGSQSKGEKNENARRERLWFSPGCLRADGVANSGPLFAGL